MARTGAAVGHEHECIGMDHVGGRWVARCRCGTNSIALTIESAARKHQGHASVAALAEHGA